MFWRTDDDTAVKRICKSSGPPKFYWDRTLNLTNIPEDASDL